MAAGLSGETDERLAARIAADRDERACAELFRRYNRKIYLWCYGYASDSEDALDLTQEVFRRIFSGIGGFKGRSRFSTWVYRITRNHCVSAAARRALRRDSVPIEEIEIEDQRSVDRLRQADIGNVLDAFLARAADSLSEDELEAFVLHYRDRLSVNEITKTLRCANASGARALIQSARRKLNRMVERQETVRD